MSETIPQISDDGSNLLNPKKLIPLILLMLFVVAPVTYAQGGWQGLSWGISVGFLNGLFFRNELQGVLTGLTVGLIPNIDYSLTTSIFVGFFNAFFIGIGVTLPRVTEITKRNLILSSGVGLLVGLMIGATLFFSKGISVAAVILITLVTALSMVPGLLFGSWLRPRILLYSNIWLYLREMAVYLVFFAVGYFVIALLFACWFWAVWKIFPESFNNISSTSNFFEFFYFSMVTIVTLGYGDITPKSELARGLVILETVLGIGWITVVFAAVMSHLQPKFAKISSSRIPK